jgi:hypothetical protein
MTGSVATGSVATGCLFVTDPNGTYLSVSN